jgi:hypothetical protein
LTDKLKALEGTSEQATVRDPPGVQLEKVLANAHRVAATNRLAVLGRTGGDGAPAPCVIAAWRRNQSGAHATIRTTKWFRACVSVEARQTLIDRRAGVDFRSAAR